MSWPSCGLFDQLKKALKHYFYKCDMRWWLLKNTTKKFIGEWKQRTVETNCVRRVWTFTWGTLSEDTRRAQVTVSSVNNIAISPSHVWFFENTMKHFCFNHESKFLDYIRKGIWPHQRVYYQQGIQCFGKRFYNSTL